MRTYSRRTLGALAAVAVTTFVPISTANTAAAAETLRCDSSVTVFASLANGELRKYQHDEPETGQRFRTGAMHAGGGWDLTWFVGTNNHVYQLLANGNLHRFEWLGDTWRMFGPNQSEWSEKIAEGWDAAHLSQNEIAVDQRGDFYKLADNGDITWERRSADGKWEKRVLETGTPGRYDLIAAAGDGVFFVRDPQVNSGQLYRYEYDSDSQRWIRNKSFVNGGNGSNILKQLFSPGGDVLYGQQENGDNGLVWWYRFDKETGSLLPRQLVESGVLPGMRYGAMTNTCEILGTTQPQAPIVPARFDAPNTLLQGTDRKVSHFYVNVQGGLTVAKQRYVDNARTLDYQTFDGYHQFTGTPGAVRRQDGKIEVVANSHGDGEYRGNLQTLANGTWERAALPYGGLILSDPVIVNNSAGVAAMFAVDGDGALWRRTGSRASDGLLPWVKIGGTGISTDFTVVSRGVDFEIVARHTDNKVRAAKVTDVLGAWRTFGDIAGRPAAVLHQDGDLQVVVRQADGKIFTKREDNNVVPATWTPVGDIATIGSPAAVLRGGGLVEIAVRGTDGIVTITGETAPGTNRYRAWGSPPDIGTIDSATDAAGTVLDDGTPVFSFRTPDGEIASVFGYTGTFSAQARTSAGTTAPAYTGGVAQR